MLKELDSDCWATLPANEERTFCSPFSGLDNTIRYIRLFVALGIPWIPSLGEMARTPPLHAVLLGPSPAAENLITKNETNTAEKSPQYQQAVSERTLKTLKTPEGARSIL